MLCKAPVARQRLPHGVARLRKARRVLSRPRGRRRWRGLGTRTALRFPRPDDARRLHRHDRQRQDRTLHLAARGGRARRRAGDRDRPQGRSRQPAADVSRNLRPRISQPWVDAGDAARKGMSVDELAATTADDLAQGSRRVGRGRRADPQAARSRRVRDLYARLDGRDGRCRSCARSPRRPGGARRERTQGAYRPRPSPACSRCSASRRIPSSSREHILLVRDPRRGLAQRHRSRPARRLIQAVQKPPFDKVGVFDVESFYPAKDRQELALRINGLLAAPGFAAWLEGDALDVAAPAVHRCGQAARLDRLDRAPERCRAHVRRDARAQRARGVDAASAGHDEPARALLHGRGLRLFPADRGAAVEAAAADADEAGAGVRPRRRARDPEPGRSRLQGARQRGHLVHRPAADRARQGTRDRRSARCGGDRGSRSQGAAKRRWRTSRNAVS